jgi:hypothetical protein
VRYTVQTKHLYQIIQIFKACTTCTGTSLYLARLQSFGMWCRAGTAQSQSLQTSMFDDLSWSLILTPVLTFCNWFQQIRMGPCDWWFGFLNSPVILHTTISPDKLFHYIKLTAFVLSGMRLHLSNFMKFPKCPHFIKNQLACYLRTFWYFQYCHFTSCWNKTGILHCKQIWIFNTILSVPINHEHWDYTVPTVRRNPLLPSSLYNITIFIFTTART